MFHSPDGARAGDDGAVSAASSHGQTATLSHDQQHDGGRGRCVQAQLIQGMCENIIE